MAHRPAAFGGRRAPGARCMGRPPFAAVLLTALMLSLPLAAQARVVGVGAAGFAIEHSVEVRATPARAFEVMVREVDRWWNDAHTWSGHAANLRIEPRVGGCFCERWHEGAVAHMTVARYEPGRVIVLQGGLRPLLELGASGALRWSVKALADGSGSTISWTYRVADSTRRAGRACACRRRRTRRAAGPAAAAPFGAR
ncbi:MAG: hypothetical protein U1F11_11215 [Steroidobacteraceae bacterium]